MHVDIENLEPLDNAHMVVRGGSLSIPDLEKSALRAANKFREPALSVFVLVGTLLDTLRIASISHNKIAVSTVGALHAAGFKVVESGDWPHASVLLRDRPTDQVLASFVRCFSSPFPNPIHLRP